MARYIDAKELKREILDRCFLPDWAKVLVNRIIDDTPTEDVAPVVHAHWEENEDFVGNTVYTCSHCKETFSFELGTPAENKNFYCAYCGAKMDEEEGQC